MKSFSTHIYVLKQIAYYTETTRLHYIVILDTFLRNKHIHNFTHCMSCEVGTQCNNNDTNLDYVVRELHIGDMYNLMLGIPLLDIKLL